MMIWFIGLWLAHGHAGVDPARILGAASVRDLQQLLTKEKERNLLEQVCREQLRKGLWPSACRHDPSRQRQMEASCLRMDLRQVSRDELTRDLRFLRPGACHERVARRLRILEYREHASFGPELE